MKTHYFKFKLTCLLGICLSLPLLAQEVTPVPEDELAKETIDGWNMNFFVLKCPSIQAREPLDPLRVSGMDVEANDINRPLPGLVSFIGNVRLDQTGQELYADKAEMDESKGRFNAEGNVRLSNDRMRLTSDALLLDIANQGISVDDARFQLKQSALRGEADHLRAYLDEPITIKGTSLTTCPPGESGWSFEAEEIQINTETGWGDAYHMLLKIYDIPIFYLPALSFPVDERRKSGFLYPAIGNSSRNGFELEAPWYWNIAQDKDATFDFKYYSKRGLMLGTEYRQVTKHSDNVLYLEYLPDDERAVLGEEDRYFYQVKSNYYNGDNWRGIIDVNSVSDDNYFYDFGGNFETGNRNFLNRMAGITYATDKWSISTAVSGDQLLSTNAEAYRRLPEISFELYQPFAEDDDPKPWNFNMAIEATAFRHDSALQANRVVATPELSYPVRWQWGYIEPKMKWHYSHYDQWNQQTGEIQQQDREVAIFSIDSAMTFERPVTFDDKAHIQTLEPRLFYLNVPYKAQEELGLYDTTLIERLEHRLFEDNRFSGSDRIGDTEQISAGITSRFIESENYREWLSFTIGQAYYFEDRQLNFVFDPDTRSFTDLGIDTRNVSPLLTQVEYSPNENWLLGGQLEYNDRESRTEQGLLSVQYLTPALIVNLRHRTSRYQRAENIEQSEFSFAYAVSDDFSLIGRWKQDLQKNRTIDSFVGLEYEDCCWALRLVYRKFLNIRLDSQGLAIPGTGEYNNGIYLEFVLKGLTNIGRRMDIANDIYGYSDRFNPEPN